MTPRQPQAERRASSSSASPAFVALMATVVYGAFVICVDGFISLLTNTDVISDPDVGPLIGPIMGVVSCALVFRSVFRGFSSPPNRAAKRALVTAFMVYAVATAIGGLLFAIGRGEPLAVLFFLTQYLVSPFVISAALIALIVVALVPLIASREPMEDHR